MTGKDQGPQVGASSSSDTDSIGSVTWFCIALNCDVVYLACFVQSAV